jgi:hypothetical protein
MVPEPSTEERAQLLLDMETFLLDHPIATTIPIVVQYKGHPVPNNKVINNAWWGRVEDWAKTIVDSPMLNIYHHQFENDLLCSVQDFIDTWNEAHPSIMIDKDDELNLSLL